MNDIYIIFIGLIIIIGFCGIIEFTVWYHVAKRQAANESIQEQRDLQWREKYNALYQEAVKTNNAIDIVETVEDFHRRLDIQEKAEEKRKADQWAREQAELDRLQGERNRINTGRCDACECTPIEE